MTKVYEETHATWSRWAAEYLHQSWADRGMPQSIFQSFMAYADLCESPIERQMFAGLLFCPFGYYDEINRLASTEELVAEGMPIKFGGWRAIIIPQAIVAGLPYRVDFLIVLNADDSDDPPMFVVECDGHDFHERTKEQAARDRRRDRDIQAAELPILRFTGSEIHRDLDSCIAQIDMFGARILEKRSKGR